MISKNSTLKSIALQKCPRCHVGNMFENAVYSTQFMRMYNTCSHCGLDFIQEPSFYFGAMYFSYAIQVAIFVMVYIILRFTFNPHTWTYVVWMITASFLILPLNYRVARVMWINLFISYKAKDTANTQTK
jgi:uncharacterized protein (DUF983 family)